MRRDHVRPEQDGKLLDMASIPAGQGEETMRVHSKTRIRGSHVNTHIDCVCLRPPLLLLFFGKKKKQNNRTGTLAAGADGADVADGADGADGAEGADGADDAVGADDADSADGADGADDADGGEAQKSQMTQMAHTAQMGTTFLSSLLKNDEKCCMGAIPSPSDHFLLHPYFKIMRNTLLAPLPLPCSFLVTSYYKMMRNGLLAPFLQCSFLITSLLKNDEKCPLGALLSYSFRF